mmetsp:Transcript_13855/g.52726  ORF Transcript_13855/g.52726 Transcript_13855/m.52726 type:complete len:274 (+) Transcript_13855:228-1049(+)
MFPPSTERPLPDTSPARPACPPSSAPPRRTQAAFRTLRTGPSPRPAESFPRGVPATAALPAWAQAARPGRGSQRSPRCPWPQARRRASTATATGASPTRRTAPGAPLLPCTWLRQWSRRPSRGCWPGSPGRFPGSLGSSARRCPSPARASVGFWSSRTAAAGSGRQSTGGLCWAAVRDLRWSGRWTCRSEAGFTALRPASPWGTAFASRRCPRRWRWSSRCGATQCSRSRGFSRTGLGTTSGLLAPRLARREGTQPGRERPLARVRRRPAPAG